jgi:hypothetical protein
MLRVWGYCVTNFIKGVAKKLGKWGIGAVGAIIIGLACWAIPHYCFSEHPIEPNITSSPGTNSVVNTNNIQTIVITANPDFEPAYTNEIEVIVHNDNARKCYMVIEFKTSEGFKFLPSSDNLPDNFTVQERYEYKDVMTVYIKDFPPKFDYHLIFSVYTMDFDTFGGTEHISWEILEIQYED